ncbi:MAG: winged helix-turn-helix domain-containing protein [Prevotella sp.]|nr:winged helix-turn-helix domain-containing protein [Candidatus Equicola stercoris]
MYLHEAIEQVLKANGHPMTSREIANAINAKKLYARGDGQQIPASQISARVNNHPDLYVKIDGKIILSRWSLNN